MVKSNTMCLVNLFLNLLSENDTISSGLQTTTRASSVFSLVPPKNTAALVLWLRGCKGLCRSNLLSCSRPRDKGKDFINPGLLWIRIGDGLFLSVERWLWQELWPCPITEQRWFSPPRVSRGFLGGGWVRGCSWWLQLLPHVELAQGSTRWGVLHRPSLRLVASGDTSLLLLDSLGAVRASPQLWLSTPWPCSISVPSSSGFLCPELPCKSRNTQVLLGEENSVFALHLAFCLGFFRALH